MSIEPTKQSRGHINWGGLQILEAEKHEPTCIGVQPHRWDGPTSTGADGWTLCHATKCSRCGALFMEVVQA